MPIFGSLVLQSKMSEFQDYYSLENTCILDHHLVGGHPYGHFKDGRPQGGYPVDYLTGSWMAMGSRRFWGRQKIMGFLKY
jgi:hypothetical protein